MDEPAMIGRAFQLFKLFGFSVKIDLSWFLIAILLTWSLATGLFPHYVGGLPPTAYWLMGAAGALGLFASIVLHELSHAMVARRCGIEMRGITLFIFGGVAEMADEPPNPRSELLVAIAGPIASVVLVGVFFLVSLIPTSTPVRAVLIYLAAINGLLVVFNMVPAFPLDGGRVLRSILWAWKGNLRWATRVTSELGASFGIVLFVLAVMNVLAGNLVGAMWWFLLGIFLRGTARMSYQQLLVRRMFEGEPVGRFMKADPVAVPQDITLQQFVDDYVFTYHHKLFPVMDNVYVHGCVTTSQLKKIPRSQWSIRTVGEVAEPRSLANTISPDSDALEALNRMNRTGRSRLLVVEGDRLVGVVTLKDLLDFLSLKIELESDLDSSDRD